MLPWRCMAMVEMSVCQSVCLSVTRWHRANTMQARITKNICWRTAQYSSFVRGSPREEVLKIKKNQMRGGWKKLLFSDLKFHISETMQSITYNVEFSAVTRQYTYYSNTALHWKSLDWWNKQQYINQRGGMGFCHCRTSSKQSAASLWRGSIAAL